jgi:hypothetical protein
MNQVDRHLRYKAIGLCTLAFSLLPAAFAASIGDPVQLAGAFFGWAIALYLLASGGTLVAALTFGSGEPMRPAWLLLSASYLVLIPPLLRVGPKAEGLYQGAFPVPWLAPVASIVSGALAVTSLFLLARAWRASGLDGSSRRARLVARLAALAVAAALAGPELVERLPAALRGDVTAAGDVITDLLDGGLFVVAVPVLQAALRLGGGLAAWPWGLLTASLVAWLGYDAAAMYGAAAGLDPRSLRILEEVLRTTGAAFAFSAGLAQRWVMTGAVSALGKPRPGP